MRCARCDVSRPPVCDSAESAAARARRYLEKIMKFINRNAYIIVAIKGYTYCGSAIRAFKLIVNNIGRLAAVNVIGDALIFLGKARCSRAACIRMARFERPLSSFGLRQLLWPSCVASSAHNIWTLTLGHSKRPQ